MIGYNTSFVDSLPKGILVLGKRTCTILGGGSLHCGGIHREIVYRHPSIVTYMNFGVNHGGPLELRFALLHFMSLLLFDGFDLIIVHTKV